ncbi:hypothetical protein NESM_000581100 [Novymonas esmeraldas]|uniref:EF-hand domain-containing protein n=1 Tax=Novymonas esmeraldas TaxID=1808958 RepID=A0AAW0ET52_9TRYP
MATLTNNNIREDAIFKRRVKDVLLCHGGTGGLVNVLLDFNARAAAAADVGLSYAKFLRFLEDHEVTLTPFEAAYLCRAFDDDGTGVISANTFVRHLTGLNTRRLIAVQQAWQLLEQRDGAIGDVARELLLSTYGSVAAERVQRAAATSSGGVADGAAHDAVASASSTPPVGGALAATFGGADGTQTHLKEAYLASMMGRHQAAWRAGADADSGDDGHHHHHHDGAGDGAAAAVMDVAAAERVSYSAFLAFYAGVSRDIGQDETFVTHVLQSWAADDVTRPTLDETARTWGPDGDPLALDGPRYVKDALHMELGRSTKSYNYTHMQRVHPYVEPLPPLHRPTIMTTTVRRTYVPYDAAGQTLANPLQTRRGQQR